MGSHPINLALRFALELTALGAVGYWGYRREPLSLRVLACIGLPLALAVMWGVFAVPDDPSRSGRTVVVTPGWARLVLELSVFAAGTAALAAVGAPRAAIGMGIIVLLHYAASYDRVLWLLRR